MGKLLTKDGITFEATDAQADFYRRLGFRESEQSPAVETAETDETVEAVVAIEAVDAVDAVETFEIGELVEAEKPARARASKK